MLYFSHFFTSFFTGLLRICLHAKVRDSVFIICLLLVGIDCVTDKLNEKHALLSSNLAPRMHFRALKFQNFLGPNAPRPPPPPPRERGPTAQSVTHSIQTCWQLQFLLKSLPENTACFPRSLPPRHTSWRNIPS